MKKFFKRELFEDNIDEVKNLTLVIKPTPEVVEAYIKNKLVELFKKHNVGSKKNPDNNMYDEYDVNLYLPQWFENGKKQMAIELCFVTISCHKIEDKKHILEIMNIFESELSEYLIDFYVANLSPVHVLKVLDKYDGAKFGLNDFLMVSQIAQKELGDKTGFSKSYISEVTNGKQALSFEMFRKISEVFPLSCYEFLI